jgi:hypothetical protein
MLTVNDISLTIFGQPYLVTAFRRIRRSTHLTHTMSEPLRRYHGTSITIKKDHTSCNTIKKEELEASFDENDITLLDTLSARSGHAVEQLSEQEIRKIIGAANHDLLYTSGNNAYIKTWDELNRLK